MTKDENLREVPHRERPRRDPEAHNSPGGRTNTPQHSAGDYGDEPPSGEQPARPAPIPPQR